MGARAALWGVALLCALGLGRGSPAAAQGSAGDPSCAPGRLLRGAGPDARCCGPCASAEACPGGRCTCLQPEFHCADPECQTCKHHPCPPGQGAKAFGNFTFGFKCVDCAVGTFSGGREGRCTPWADCSRLGLPTMSPGNKTHNAVCSPVPPPAEPRCPLTAVLAVAACVLVLVAAQLGLHLWQLRRQRVWSPEARLLPEAPPPPEDACSCQFPEEERGEQLSEDKDPLGTCE
ncbi:tumor necrosis factor receptor superfamily member 18 [Pipistrellus kuhlii]|uniref:TNF receptor superfamily member 18 n=1 Tax=Pipistrellus kuhlii TaxID=59472 RepID=A0A7J7QVA5_PIPKU|nr:tumor necrosis factor receptor superfamily member 18 [Pipistrellus kuhlii]KAF6267655.1 TNF receptor superfamily member 18 [Pipistrellus kuhlii]